jgi:hypothetical protein
MICQNKILSKSIVFFCDTWPGKSSIFIAQKNFWVSHIVKPRGDTLLRYFLKYLSILTTVIYTIEFKKFIWKGLVVMTPQVTPLHPKRDNSSPFRHRPRITSSGNQSVIPNQNGGCVNRPTQDAIIITPRLGKIIRESRAEERVLVRSRKEQRKLGGMTHGVCENGFSSFWRWILVQPNVNGVDGIFGFRSTYINLFKYKSIRKNVYSMLMIIEEKTHTKFKKLWNLSPTVLIITNKRQNVFLHTVLILVQTSLLITSLFI